MSKNSKIRNGDVFKTNQGCEIVVIQYHSSSNIDVEFRDSSQYSLKTTAQRLRRGDINNPYLPRKYGIGYFGVGKYTSTVDNKPSPEYNSWGRMMQRCYCENYRLKDPSYIGVQVCDEWLNFQNFAEWFHNQPNAGRKDFHLDKDLRVMGSKIYSPSTCSFIPRQVNALLNQHSRQRGSLRQGVKRYKNGFYSVISMYGEEKYLGCYPTEEETYQVYKQARENYVRDVATRYKNDLHPEVYQNLMSWELD